jgi:CRP/FNR family transcriptional regulator, anaerobic regulatory protein
MVDIQQIFKDIFEVSLIRELEKQGRVHSFNAGETIMDVGQTVRFMPIILKGNIKVTRMDDEGREILLYFVHGVESCAMTFTCCMQQKSSEIKATAEEDTLVIMIPVGLMDEWIVKYPTWKSFVMQTMMQRFNELLKTIDSIAFQKLDERLIQYLKDRSKAAGSSLLNVTHQQIADELATSRVVISRLLKKLENDKKILLYRNQIKLLKAMFG